MLNKTEPDPIQDLELKFAKISKNIRCMTCPNQSIGDSNSPVAVSMRNDILKQLKENRTESQILDSLILRYGDGVVYSPPVQTTTYVLWYAPLVALVLVFAIWGKRQLNTLKNHV